MWRFTSSGPGPSLSTLHPAHPCPRAPKPPAFSHYLDRSRRLRAQHCLFLSAVEPQAQRRAPAATDPMRHREAISTMHCRLSVPRGVQCPVLQFVHDKVSGNPIWPSFGKIFAICQTDRKESETRHSQVRVLPPQPASQSLTHTESGRARNAAIEVAIPAHFTFREYVPRWPLQRE